MATADPLSSTTTMTTTYWPAEWEYHRATILIYPHNSQTFRLQRARNEFHHIVQVIAEHDEEVWVISPNHPVPQLEAIPNVTVVTNIPTNDSWARDTTPTFVWHGHPTSDHTSPTTSNVLVGLDWDFNAYGGPDEGCYWPCDDDQALAKRICDHFKMACNKISIVLEGGSIHTDGIGTILTTKECLLHPNRNPTLSQTEIENTVLQATGCTKAIWLENGLAHDNDTNGHIDNFACFVKPQHVVLAWTDDDVNDADNYQRCRRAMNVLQSETDAQGKPLNVHKLYLPRPIFYTEEMVQDLTNASAGDDTGSSVPCPRQVGEQMAASYVNFYTCNRVVLVPQFGDVEFDAKAVATLQELFPNHNVVGIPSVDILIGGGNIHCITQQVPRNNDSNN